MTISAKEAQDRFPDLLDQVAQGEIVEITSGDGSITYRLVMVARKTAERVADRHPNALVMSDDFDEENPPFSALRGAGGGKSFRTAEEVNAYIHSLRDEWES